MVVNSNSNNEDFNNAESLEEVVLRFEAICNSISVGIGILDKNSLLVDCNSSLLKIFGIEDKQEWLDSKVCFENDPNICINTLKADSNNTYVVDYDFGKISEIGFFKTTNKGHRFIEFKTSKLINSQNRHIGYVWVSNDVTSTKHQKMVQDAIYDHIPIGIELYDKEGLLIYINQFNIKTFGIANLDEVLGTNLFDDPNIPDYIKDRTRAGENFDYEIEYDLALTNKPYYKTPLTGKRYFSVKNVAIRDQDGELEGYMLTNSDITEKRLRQHLLDDTQRNLALGLEAGNVSTWKYDIEKQEFITIMGNTISGSGMSLDVCLSVLHPEDKEPLLAMLSSISSAKSDEGEILLRFFDAQSEQYIYYISQMIIRFDESGQRTYIIGTQRDITDKYAHKLEMDNARQSLAMAMHTSKVSAWDYDLHTKRARIFYSDELFKYTDGPIIEQMGLHPEDTNRYKNFINKVSTGIVDKDTIEIRIKNKDDVYRYYECFIANSRNNEGKITHLIGSTIDISERRDREKTDRELSASLEIIINAAEVSVWKFDIAERKFYAMLGNILMTDGTTYQECSETIAPDSREDYHKAFDRLLNGESDKESTILHIINAKTGKDEYYLSEFAMFSDDNGNRSAIVGTQREITEEIIQKKRLEDFKIKTDLTNEKNHIVQWDYDLSQQYFITQGNSALHENQTMDRDTYLSYIHPDDRQLTSDYIDQISSGKLKTFDIILRCLLPDHSDYRYVVINALPIKDHQGNVVSYTGIRRDATEEILQRKQLAEKTYKTTLVTKASGIISWEYDCIREVFISEDNNIRGYEMGIEDYLEMLHPNERTIFNHSCDIIRGCKDESFSVDFKYNYLGKWRYATFAGEPYEKDPNGKVIRYLGYRKDTTEQTLMNENIKESKFKTDMAIKNANMVMWEYVVEEKMFTAFNDPLTNYDITSKYSPAEYIAVLDPSTVQSAKDAVAFMDRQQVGEFSFNSKIMLPNSPDWQYITIHGSNSEVSKDDPTKAIKYIGFRVDNTEFVKLSQSIEEYNTLTSSILSQSPSAIFIKDISDNWKYIIANDLFCQLFDYTHERIIGFTDYEIFDNTVAEKFRKDDFKALNYDGIYSFVEEVKSSIDGHIKVLHTTKRIITIANGRQLLIGISSDITETITQQRAIEQANKKAELILNNTNTGLAYIDNDFRVIWENTASIKDNSHIDRYKRGCICYKSIAGLDQPCSDCIILKAKESRNSEKNTKVFEDGTVLDMYATPVIGEDNQINGYVCRLDNVTEAHLQNSALEKSHQDLRLALEAGNVSTWLYNVENRMLYFLRNNLLTEQGICIDEYLQHFHTDDIQKQIDLFGTLITGTQESGNFVFRYKDDDVQGGYRYYENRMIAKKEDGRTIIITGTQKNITEDVLKTKKLEDTQKYLDLAIDAGEVAVWGYDPKEDVVFNISGKVFEQDVLPLEEANKTIHPDDALAFKETWDKLINRQSDKESMCVRFKNPFIGKFEYIDKSMIALRYPSGELEMIIGTHHDVTEDKVQKIALEDSNEKLNMALDVIKAFSWHCDLRDGILHFDSTFISLGLDPEAMNSMYKFSEHIHSDDRQDFLDIIEDITAKEDGEFISAYRIDLRNDGNYEWWECRGKIKIMSENGRTYKYLYGMDCNITHHKQITDELTKAKVESDNANALMQSIIRQIPSGLYIKDIDNEFRYVIMNDILANIDGVESKDALGKTDYDLFDKEIADLFRQGNTTSVNVPEGEVTVIKNVIEWQGQKNIYENSDMVITVADGRRLLIGVVADVTEKEYMIRELKESKERAEQSDKLKSAFLANMSHEIRTPLNAIVGFSELLIDAEDATEREEYTNIISVNNELLLRLISDILDLSKIESGMIELKSEEFDISDICDEVYMMLKQKVTNPEINFSVENPYASCIVELDKNRLKQVGINFITNAIKYTAKGMIKMGYKYVDKGIRIYVEDTGIGISEDNYNKVFDRFEKFDSFAQGTGLGLSICKAIVDAQGGKIGFESELGKGSTFWAWFPCQAEIKSLNSDHTNTNKSDQDSLSSKNTSDIQDFKILIAEDNDSNYMLVKHILKNYSLTRAINGAEAVEKARYEQFDMILMDWKMPILNGLEATIQIREFDKNIPIIAVTANAFDSNKVSILKAGCNAFVAKPLKKKELMDTINMFH